MYFRCIIKFQYINPFSSPPKFAQIMLTYFPKWALIACLSIICIGKTVAQTNSLRIQDPQLTWKSGTARIESASFDVRPRGLYAEISLNMTYSAQGTSYIASTDTLEIQHYFTLPANALVTDSWLTRAWCCRLDRTGGELDNSAGCDQFAQRETGDAQHATEA